MMIALGFVRNDIRNYRNLPTRHAKWASWLVKIADISIKCNTSKSLAANQWDIENSFYPNRAGHFDDLSFKNATFIGIIVIP